MDDLKVLIHARQYIASMACGINPLNGEYAPEGDTISNERIQKCCSYVEQILTRVIENGGVGANQKRKFAITPVQKSAIKLSAEPIGVNELARRINAVTDKNVTGISGAKIASWLAENGYLSVVETPVQTVKTHKTVNERSALLGISIAEVVDPKTGELIQKPVYSIQAQRFVVDNIDKITAAK